MAFYHGVLIRIDYPNYRKGHSQNSHTEPIKKPLNLLKTEDIFTCQCLNFFINLYINAFLYFFNHYFCKMLLTMIFPQGNVIKSLSNTVIPREPENVLDKVYMHSLYVFSTYTKQYLLTLYKNSCTNANCYICT